MHCQDIEKLFNIGDDQFQMASSCSISPGLSTVRCGPAAATRNRFQALAEEPAPQDIVPRNSCIVCGGPHDEMSLACPSCGRGVHADCRRECLTCGLFACELCYITHPCRRTNNSIRLASRSGSTQHVVCAASTTTSVLRSSMKNSPTQGLRWPKPNKDQSIKFPQVEADITEYEVFTP